MNNNDKKCDKYESFFVFSDEKTFMAHVKNCPDCRSEYEKYSKVSLLVKEAAPYYLKREKRKKQNLMKSAACFFILMAGLTGFTGYKIYDENSFQVNTADESYIGTMGLPTDEYGFLEI